MKRTLKDLFTTNFIKALARTLGLSGPICSASRWWCAAAWLN
jgi:hypothetical protein